MHSQSILSILLGTLGGQEALIIFIFLGIIVFVIFNSFRRDRNKMLKTQVDKYGGMRNKYSILVNYFLAEENSSVIEEGRDLIYIYCRTNIDLDEHIFIVENFDSLNIKIVFTRISTQTKREQNWTFPGGTPAPTIYNKLMNFRVDAPMALFK